MNALMEDLTGVLSTPAAITFDRTGLLWMLGGMLAVGLFWLYQWSMSQRNWRDREEYGSARWAKPDEMGPPTRIRIRTRTSR